ncbi:hypothetical protein SAMN06265795_11114 [Noviherbaspirillum humi]|uniref:Uncharacterized protein n=1 Tax=Noviherbaspirillum humi TaxID=1688639 RepID=A0A239IXL3_9BURK|nr:hypothetical protein [Noviherbaspirillum humi]SNS98299.1 hypothetical protein SAMN06265795_11114 [Noviherbaspirillum humi]
MNASTSDGGIPLLTEVIAKSDPEPETAPAQAPAPAPEAAPAAPEPIAVLEQRASDEWSEERWTRLEDDLRERVLQQVLGRIDFVLEQRVRDSLADVLQLAVSNLANDIRDGLHQTMREVVTRAVSQEITKIQALKKQK